MRKNQSEYVCSACGETCAYDPNWSEEDSQKEFRENFGREPDPDTDTVICDVCYQKMMARASAKGWVN